MQPCCCCFLFILLLFNLNNFLNFCDITYLRIFQCIAQSLWMRFLHIGKAWRSDRYQLRKDKALDADCGRTRNIIYGHIHVLKFFHWKYLAKEISFLLDERSLQQATQPEYSYINIPLAFHGMTNLYILMLSILKDKLEEIDKGNNASKFKASKWHTARDWLLVFRSLFFAPYPVVVFEVDLDVYSLVHSSAVEASLFLAEFFNWKSSPFDMPRLNRFLNTVNYNCRTCKWSDSIYILFPSHHIAAL